MRKVWGSIAMVGLAGLCLLTFLRVASAQPSGDTREVKQTIPVTADAWVSIETFKGSITTEASDRLEVNILARIEPAGLSAREREAVKQVEIKIRTSGNGVDILSDYEQVKNLNHRGDGDWKDDFEFPIVHYPLFIPRSARLEIKDFKSEIKATGLENGIRVKSHKGPITLTDLKGEVRIDAYKGNVRITGLDGSLDLNTHKSDVEIEFVRMTGRTRIESFKGDVQITLPEKDGFEL
ncbi:MAG: DUF4097 family beta strand repeat protein, partial [candidate division Zixibacteria bacterium]|nr:DUF4097 family beta strand repeat protein [candidate division Zixibacteria bacterium]